MGVIRELNAHLSLIDDKMEMLCSGCKMRYNDGGTKGPESMTVNALGLKIPECVCPECGGTKWDVKIFTSLYVGPSGMEYRKPNDK